MTRTAVVTVLGLLSVVAACRAPAAQAKESPMLSEADKLFKAGQYNAALAKYDAVLGQPPDERNGTRALFRAAECETLLGRHEKALDRLRAARLPGDAALRGVVQILRLSMLSQVENWYGFRAETEEGASGSAKLSRAQATREKEAALAGLWSDRQALAHTALGDVTDLLDLEDTDLGRYPSLWDFAVQRAGDVLAAQRGAVDALAFTAADFPRQLGAGEPGPRRLGALYEESAVLDGGKVDRAAARERWRVLRVLIPERLGLPMSESQRNQWRAQAVSRLKQLAHDDQTALGRGDAAGQAARLLVEQQHWAEALPLVDATVGKTPESDAAVLLRRLRHEILERQIAIDTEAALPPATDAIHVRARNLGAVSFSLYRIDPVAEANQVGSGNWRWFSSALHYPSIERLRQWLAQKPLVTWSVKLDDQGDHQWTEKRVTPPQAARGYYLVVVSGQGKDPPIAAAYLNVTDLALARADDRGDVRYYAFDAATKQPAAGVRVRQRYSASYGTPSDGEVTTGPDGVATWKLPNAQYFQVDALAQRGDAWALLPQALWRYRREPEPPLVLFLATDRPIYRPGQEVKARVTSVARAGEGAYKIDPARALRLVLIDVNGKEVAAHDVTTGELGSASVSFTVPASGLLGRYTLRAAAPGLKNVVQAVAISVEEYKRPEFEVTLEAPTAGARYGERASLHGKVQYYFGGAAASVPVRYVVSRRRWLPWWRWRGGDSALTEIARGDVKTDDQGGFTVAFTAVPDPERAPSDDPDVPDVADYVVQVEAHDAGGRTIAAERTLRVGAQALLIHAEGAHGFFFSNEAVAARLTVTNLDEVAVAADLWWEIDRLGAPKAGATAADGPLETQLRGYAVAEARLAHGTVHVDKEHAGQPALPTLAAGVYRLRLGQVGGAAKANTILLVADAKTRALPAPLPPVAIARTAELEPGQRAELLVGTGAAGGAYHLELWRGDRLLDHRVERGAPVRVWTVPVSAREAGGFSARWIGTLGVRIAGGDVTLSVPRKDKLLTVKLTPRADAVDAGAHLDWGVELRDGKGRLVDGEALVAVYDRSLELYANERPSWATNLWAPPPAPSGRTDSTTALSGVVAPIDEQLAQRINAEIVGSYKPKDVPHFPWERSLRHRAMPMMAAAPATKGAMREAEDGALAAPPPAPMAQSYGAKQEIALAEKKADNGALGGGGPGGAAAAPAVRTNMAETALFLPDLRVRGGHGRFRFTAPERLSSWRVRILALGKLVEAGVGEDSFATRKQLMVRVEIPRFFREGDRSTVTAVVHNETDRPLSGRVTLAIDDESSGASALARLGVANPSQAVEVPAHGLRAVDFAVHAPDGLASYRVRAAAVAGTLGDAEERTLPILPSRERLVESRVVALRGDDKKTIAFDELARSDDPSLRSESMVVAIDPQLALSVLRAIPSLLEYPYECVEQTLNRYVPLAIVNEIYKRHPELGRALEHAPPRKTQTEPWLARDPRRLTALTETPWLAASEGGSQDERLRSLLDAKLVAAMRGESLAKLTAMQAGSGGFPWFPGGRENPYMTLYVLEQLAQLQDFGVEAPRDLVARALGYVVRELSHFVDKDEVHLAYLAYASYVLTAFDARRFPEAARLRPTVERWMSFVLDARALLTPYGRAWCARVEERLGNHPKALELLDSALDGAKSDPVTGVYWAPERYAWMWYSDSVEKHAFFLRTLVALKPEDTRIPGMVQWLLFNRKGNVWHSTKASAAAAYAILDVMERSGALTKPEKLHLQWGKQESFVTLKPTEDRREPLLWRVAGPELGPAYAKVEVSKEGPGIAFASATWIYSSAKLRPARAGNLVSIERTYFKKVHQADGDHLVPLHSGDTVHVGDEIEVRLAISTKSQFEYVQVKEPRGAGFEETTLTSGYRWDKVPAYQEPRDSLFNFFVDWLPNGELELRHSLRPTTPGKYRIGSAVLQSMYSPDITAYSSGMELEVVR